MSPLTWLGRLGRRLRALVHGRALDSDLDEEIRFHLAMEAEDAVRRGLSPEAAAAQARLAFGGVQRFREEAREARGVRFVNELRADLRYGVRTLRRAPAFTTVALATLAIGIGATSAMFSVVHTVVLRPLPFPDEGALVSVWDGGHSRAEFVAVRDRVRSLSSVATYMAGYDMTLGGEGEPQRVITALVSADFFRTLGVLPALGRFFERGEDRPGVTPIAVLGDALWRTRFGSDPTVLGRTIDLDGVRRTVVGVAPASLAFPGTGTQLWVPLEIDPSRIGPHWGAYGHPIIGRLAPGATPLQARDDVRGVARALIAENPLWRPDPASAEKVTVTPLRGELTRESRPVLYLLLGAVGLVLLIVCANVANLLMVRGAARTHEMALRATLGAGTRRLARQLLTESLLLAGCGGVLGTVVAAGLTRVLVQLLPEGTPRLAETTLDGAAVAFTVVVTLVTGCLFGLLPARRLVGHDPASALATARATTGRQQRRAAGLLVGAQVSLALVLVVGAGLLARSLGRLLRVDPGFATVSIVTARVSPPRATYEAAGAQRAFMRRLLDQLNASPGIAGAAISSQVPFEPRNEVMAMWIDGYTSDPNQLELFEIRRVSPRFFAVMGIPIRSGRGLLDSDGEGAALVGVVSEAASHKYWEGRDGSRRLRFPWPGWITVVGVAGDVRNNDLRASALPTLYVPFDQDPRPFVTVVARATQGTAAAHGAIRSAVRSIAADVAVSDEDELRRLVDRSVSAPRAVGLLLTGFGAVALLLGGIGTYGLVAYGVERRRREFAVRVAVGARRGAVVGLVLREGLTLTLVGIVVGIAAALGLSRLLRGLLFEVSPSDPVAFLVAPAVLLLVAAVACAVPAWRALRVDPNGALRGE